LTDFGGLVACALMDQTLLGVLRNVGFSEKEARVYAALAELGEGTAAKISQKTELKRPSVYVILGSLIARGYASEVPGKKVSAYQATDANAILRRLQEKIKDFSDFVPVIRTLANRGGARPKISYFENKEGILNVYESINHTPSAFFITSYARIERHFPGLVDKWIHGLEKGRYKLKGVHIVPDDEEELTHARRFISVGQKVRKLGALKGIAMDFSIFDNKLAISNLGEKLFMVVIESEGIVRSVQAIFEVVWSAAKEV